MKRLRFVLALTLSLVAVIAPSRQAAAQSLSAALPADTVLYVRFNDIEEMLTKIKSSPLKAIGATDDWNQLAGMVQGGWAQAEAGARQELGIELTELISSCQGEIAIAVGGLGGIATAVGQALSTLEEPEITTDMIPVLISVDTKKSTATFLKNWSKIVAFAKQSGVPVKEEKVGSNPLTTFSRPEGETDGPEGIVVGQVGSRILFGLSPMFVKSTMKRLGSTTISGGLAADPLYKATAAKTGENGDMYMYVNLKSITSAVDGALSASMFAFFWQKAQQLLIGKSLNNMAVSMTVGNDGIHQKAFAHNSGASDGMLGWLKTDPMDPVPSPLIPKNASTFSSLGVNGGQIVGVVREVIQTVLAFRGVGADVDTMVEQQVGVKLTDIEKALGKKAHIFQVDGATPQNPFGDLTVTFELNDDGPFKKLLSKLSELSQGQLANIESKNGKPLYTADTGLGFSPSFSATDKLFILGMSRRNVERVLTKIGSKTSELGASKAFKKFSADEWTQAGADAGVCIQKIRSPEEGLTDPLLLAD
ncbi:MAG: hypothetical protein AAF517_14945, partial [Planctomycetota bacterium]